MTKLVIRVYKARDTIEINTNTLPDEVRRQAVIEGLTAIVNRGMTRLTTLQLDKPGMMARAKAKAIENYTAMQQGKIRFPSLQVPE